MGTRIKESENIKVKLEEKNSQTIGEKLDDYADQMYTYLGSYTKGNLHARVLKGKGSDAFEIYRDLVHKGKNINMHRIIVFKTSILQPKKVIKAEDLDKVLTEWKYEQQLVTEFDGSELNEENQKSILMTIMPKEHVEYMRDHFLYNQFKDDCHAFEQELYNRIDQKKLDEDHHKKGINQMGAPQPTTYKDPADVEYENIKVWSEEWQCMICGLVPKRSSDEEEEGDSGKDDELKNLTCKVKEKVTERAKRKAVERKDLA